MNEFINVFKKAFIFSGRSRRREYWMFVLFSAIFNIVLSIVDAIAGLNIAEDMGLLSGLFSLLIIIPSLSVTIRRLHDIGKSGWWILIALIPIIGWIVLFIFSLLDSQPGSNAYGPSPKESNSDYAMAK
ncbi:DUF805 domain-containing protein [Planococcus shenhongbingii]|uniref:DUF805 domain-containing protein n=1 Tax=Planococcus shenhongbingii TaxID=3058398 RepID=A0ABT8N9K2_9BACL|nr:DUF805 domain-containing protein [Planococcus sp. N017]MDN7244536.1 DUF805 domain-containing protein [Planococcus sp. N017]